MNAKINCNLCNEIINDNDVCESYIAKFIRKKIIIICTGNSCRSQMAEGWLRSFDDRLDIISAGIKPEISINKFAVNVMKEVGIHIEGQYPKSVYNYKDYEFDYIITLCNNAKSNCPVFSSNTAKYLHIPLEDPADSRGNDAEILKVYRKVRDQIKDNFYEFYRNMTKY